MHSEESGHRRPPEVRRTLQWVGESVAINGTAGWLGVEFKPGGRYSATPMGDLRLEWDPEKNKQNRRKHGVAFEEAESVFADEHGLFMADPDHADDEDRFILLGLSSGLRTLVVCHCYRKTDDVVRIFSARKADASERGLYNRMWKR